MPRAKGLFRAKVSYINDFVFITFNKKVGEHETDKPRGMPNIPIDGYFIMPLDTLRIFHCIEPSDEDSNTFQMLLLPFKIYSDFHYYYENYYSDEFIYDDKLDDYYHHTPLSTLLEGVETEKA